MPKTVEKTFSTPAAYLEATYPGIEIVDAQLPLDVTVTNADRRRSSRKDPRSCALAVACGRQEDVEDAIVTRSYAYVVYPVKKRGRHTGWRAVRHFLSPRSREAVIDFDQSGEFPAGQYRFSAVPPTQRLGYNRTAKGKRSGATTGERAPRRLPGLRTVISAKS